MHKRGLLKLRAARIAVILGLLSAAAPAVGASSEQVLFSFCILAGCPGGANPQGKLIFDAAGNLYGVTYMGGRYGDGTAFELAPSHGKWKHKVVHHFNRHGKDGAFPMGGLLLDGAGHLYGTTSCYVDKCGAYGYGNVFELILNNGEWTEKVLHSFNETDGAYPSAGLIFDVAGNLYGTTVVGGTYGRGVVFELSPHADGKWTETVLHSFNPADQDASNPVSSLTIDTAGNLYGATDVGGSYDNGTVFELLRNNGKWTEQVLYNFGQGSGDAISPDGVLVFDQAGNLYGSAGGGGKYASGAVFELRENNGNWTEEVLYSFTGKYDYNPQPVILDGAGNLYGTTVGTGLNGGQVFKLIPSNGNWTEQVLHRFTRARDGEAPSGPLILDSAGSLYGLTYYGGTTGNGTVFQVRP